MKPVSFAILRQRVETAAQEQRIKTERQRKLAEDSKKALESSKRFDKPIVVDFWAEWCGPCKMIAPILAEIAAEQPGVTVAKLNIDDHPDLAMRYNVMSIPTMLVFKNGEVVNKIVGAKAKSALLADLAPVLG